MKNSYSFDRNRNSKNYKFIVIPTLGKLDKFLVAMIISESSFNILPFKNTNM